MATWGTAVGSNNQARLGYDVSYSPANPTSSTSSVTVTLTVYLWTRYSVSDSTNNYAVSGDFSGSGSANVNHGSSSSWSTSNRTTLYSSSKSFTLFYTTTQTVSFSASMTGLNAISGTPTVSGSITLPKRPVTAPANHTNVNVTRSSDTRQNVTWTRNATTSAPYDSQVLQRWDSYYNAYRTIANLSGTATSYADQSTVANRRYRYRILAKNDAGQSAYVPSPYISTTPAEPLGVKATKVGSDIVVSWGADHVHYADGFQIVESQNGGAWNYAGQVTVADGSARSWTHSSPSTSVSHRYAVRTRTEGPLYSEYVQTGTVQLLAPPLAPTGLSPASGAADADKPIVLTWQHNPVDTTDQVGYQVQYRVDGGAWTVLPATLSATSSRTIAAGTWPNGALIEWQVRTRGESATYGPYSATAAFQTVAAPSATIVSPVGEFNSSTATLVWDYFDPADMPQSSYRVWLYAGAGTSGAVLASGTYSGAATSRTFTPKLTDGATYTAAVQVRNGAGVWSDVAAETFTVEYLPPPTGVLTGVWDLDTGTVTVEVSHPAPTANEVEGLTCAVYRSANGGPWVLLGEGLPLETAVVDAIPATEGVNEYRVVTVSELPSTAESEPVAVPVASDGWIFVNGGPGFSLMVKVRDNAKTSYSPSRTRDLHHFAGRSYPVEVTGQSRTLGITADVRLGGGSSTWDQIEELLDGPAPFCYRDMTRREFVGRPTVSHSYERIFRDMSLSFERIDYAE